MLLNTVCHSGLPECDYVACVAADLFVLRESDAFNLCVLGKGKLFPGGSEVTKGNK